MSWDLDSVVKVEVAVTTNGVLEAPIIGQVMNTVFLPTVCKEGLYI